MEHPFNITAKGDRMLPESEEDPQTVLPQVRSGHLGSGLSLCPTHSAGAGKQRAQCVHMYWVASDMRDSSESGQEYSLFLRILDPMRSNALEQLLIATILVN